MAKFKNIIIMVVSLAVLPLFAWEKYYGSDYDDYGRSVCEDIYVDGGYVIGGTTVYSESNFDAYLVSIDMNGVVEWSNNYGTPEWREIICSIRQTSDYGFIAAGETWPLHPHYEQWSYPYLIKTNYAGNQLWSYRGISYKTLSSVVEISSNVYVATGWAKYGGLPPVTVLYWVKYEEVLGRGIGPTNEKFHYISFAGHSEGYCIQKISGGYIVVGGHWFENTGSAQDAQVYLLKLNDNGDRVSHKTLGEQMRTLVIVLNRLMMVDISLRVAQGLMVLAVEMSILICNGRKLTVV